MWIWELPKSRGRRHRRDRRPRARRRHRRPCSSRAPTAPPNRWAQFNPELVAALHANGLRACAWQFVYGNDPLGEASLGADAIAAGADCLVIDAETPVRGQVRRRRSSTSPRCAPRSGPRYPIGLTSFPYVDYHPRLPYSVFLGPGGAQANLPQVYWKDIGGTVDAVSGAHARPQPHLRRRDRPARPDLRQPAAGGHRALPLAVGRLRQRRPVLVVLAGDDREPAWAALDAAGRAAPAAARRSRAGPRWPRATRATRSSGCSSTSPPSTPP